MLPLRLLQLLEFQGTKTKADPKAKGRIRQWQRALIPLHLHARRLTLPKLYKGRDIIIKAPLPEYFKETLHMLHLHPKGKTLMTSEQHSEYNKLKQLGQSTKHIVGF